MEVLVRTRQGVRSRGLEVRAKGDDVATRAIRRERDTEDVAGAGNRSRIDGAGRAAGAGDTAGVAIGRGEREADGPAEADRAVRLVERGALRDRGATGQRGGRVGVTGRQHGGNDLVGANRDRWLGQQVQLRVGDRVGRTRKSVPWSDVSHD